MSAVPQIVAWANEELPPWLRDAVRRLLTSHELTDEDRKQLLMMAKAAAGLPVVGIVPAPREVVLGEVPGAPAESKPVVLQAIEDLRAVNLIEASPCPFRLDHRLRTKRRREVGLRAGAEESMSR